MSIFCDRDCKNEGICAPCSDNDIGPTWKYPIHHILTQMQQQKYGTKMIFEFHLYKILYASFYSWSYDNFCSESISFQNAKELLFVFMDEDVMLTSCQTRYFRRLRIPLFSTWIFHVSDFFPLINMKIEWRFEFITVLF